MRQRGSSLWFNKSKGGMAGMNSGMCAFVTNVLFIRHERTPSCDREDFSEALIQTQGRVAI